MDSGFDWNQEGERPRSRPVEIHDETLRDGLQSPSCTDPDVASKLLMIDSIARLPIQAVNLGLPGAGERQRDDIAEMARFVRAHHPHLEPHAACRTVRSDLIPLARIQDATGQAIMADVFIGSSPIRRDVEGWSLDWLLDQVGQSLDLAMRLGLEVMFVTEDTTRSHPADLDALYGLALRAGVRRVAICDTCGHATPAGTRRLVAHLSRLVRARGRHDVGIDWHGHRDRGLEMGNVLTAIEAGVTRVHATAWGVGERAGNLDLAMLLGNLRMAGRVSADACAGLEEHLDLVRAGLLPGDARRGFERAPVVSQVHRALGIPRQQVAGEGLS